jgi:hypothetical protein
MITAIKDLIDAIYQIINGWDIVGLDTDINTLDTDINTLDSDIFQLDVDINTLDTDVKTLINNTAPMQTVNKIGNTITVPSAFTQTVGTGITVLSNQDYNGLDDTVFTVKISGVGTGMGGVDQFVWKKGNSGYSADVDINSSTQQSLVDGFKVQWNADTGHTLDDTWECSITSGVVINSGTGILHSVLQNVKELNSQIKVYDGIDSSGAVLINTTVNLLFGSLNPINLDYSYTTGLYLVMYKSGSNTENITIGYV